MSDVVAYNKLASALDGVPHDVTSAQAHDTDCIAEEALKEADTCYEESPCPADDTSVLPDHLVAAAHPPRDGIKRRGHALLKPLIAIATAQYVIVTALVALTAVTVASEAGKIVNAKLYPIIAALKRF